MSHSQLNWGRYEAKYIISEAQAQEVRKYCAAYLPPDRHAGLRGPDYPILSVYLDSGGRDMLRDAVERSRDRVKLRVRSYRSCHQPDADCPTYLEIKRKTDGLVRKRRVPVPAAAAAGILWRQNGNAIEQVMMCARPREAEESLAQFLELRRRFQAEPTVGVFYTREAYEGASGERIRITLDRNLHCGLLAQPGVGRDRWWPVNPGGVILEIKFTDTYPFWVMHMLHRIEVIRRGVCKYVICARAAGPTAGGQRRWEIA